MQGKLLQFAFDKNENNFAYIAIDTQNGTCKISRENFYGL